MTKPIDVTEKDFDTMVLKSKVPVLVDFWATWCRPCMMIAPILDELANEYDGKMTFAKMDVAENSKLAAQYGMSLPNLIIFKNGKPAAQIVGYKSKTELKRVVDGALF
jgi:thioredoxin 1